MTEKKRRRYSCLDCELRFHKCGNYMVWNDIWKAIGNPIGCLCIPCLETRLGRILTYLDFSNVPLNYHVEAGYYPAPSILMVRLKGFLEHWKDFHGNEYTNDRTVGEILGNCSENSKQDDRLRETKGF